MLDRPHPTPAAPTLDPFALARALSGYHFIGGGYVSARSGKTFAVINPATGAEVGQVARWCINAPRCSRSIRRSSRG